MFNTIVMFNLLIAIMMEAYTKISSDSVGASYQEKCRMIAENTYLISEDEKKNLCKEGKYLLIALDLTPTDTAATTEDMLKEILTILKKNE